MWFWFFYSFLGSEYWLLMILFLPSELFSLSHETSRFISLADITCLYLFFQFPSDFLLFLSLPNSSCFFKVIIIRIFLDTDFTPLSHLSNFIVNIYFLFHLLFFFFLGISFSTLRSKHNLGLWPMLVWTIGGGSVGICWFFDCWDYFWILSKFEVKVVSIVLDVFGPTYVTIIFLRLLLWQNIAHLGQLNIVEKTICQVTRHCKILAHHF